MAFSKIFYTGPNTLACTLASLPNASGRQSAAANNVTDGGVDSIVTVKLTNGTGTAGSIDIYAYGTADGTNYTANTGTTDAVFTPTAAQALMLRKLDSIVTPASGLAYTNMFSIAGAFFTMPRLWGIVVMNNATGAAFNATAGNFTIQYSIVNYVA